MVGPGRILTRLLISATSCRILIATGHPLLAAAAGPAINWLTDVTNYKAAHIGLELSWTASELDVTNILMSVNNLKKFTQLFITLVRKYKENN